MKHMISVFIAMMLCMCTIVFSAADAEEATPTDLDGAAQVVLNEAEPTEPSELLPADYSIGAVSFANGMLKGQAIHVEGTETVKHVYVRITYFAKNGSTVIVETFVHSDGTFTSYASGSIDAIAIVLTDETGTPTKMPGDFEEFAVTGLVL